MILVISRVRAARFLLPRHLFSENITRGVTFLKKSHPAGLLFKKSGAAGPRKISKNMQRFCRVPAIPGAGAVQLLLSRHLFSEHDTRGVTFLKKKSSGGVTFQEKWGGRTSQNIKEYATFL